MRAMEKFVSRKFTTIVVACVLTLPLLLLVLRSNQSLPQDDQAIMANDKAKVSEERSQHVELSHVTKSRDASSFEATKIPSAKLAHKDSAPGLLGTSEKRNVYPNKNSYTLAGLFASGLDRKSCLSRFQYSHFHKPSSSHKLSPYLISKLRSYEALHRRCGPNSLSYNRSIEELISNKKYRSKKGCKYLIWVPENGLGNRLLSLASTFLFALLTDRVLLLDHLAAGLAGLFCEPFPNSTWLLPAHFPINGHVSREFNASYIGDRNMSEPKYIYLNPDRSDYFIDHTPFYCDNTFGVKLQMVPWVILISDQYYLPYFFSHPPYKGDPSLLFPEKDSVFYLLARYLYLPSNKAWGLITRFYQTYLAKADERIGMQVRVFYPNETPLQTVIDQIFACALKEKVLPEVDAQRIAESYLSKNRTSKSILIASLYSDFFRNFSSMYLTYPTKTGETVEVFQPSHEEYQRFGDVDHDMKAWTDIYLLSMSDVLVTSAWSTFGYVAQGLSGMKSWVLTEQHGNKVRNSPCQRAESIEPCFIFPPTYDCKTRRKIDPGAVVPYLRHCGDVQQGVKLVNVPYRQ